MFVKGFKSRLETLEQLIELEPENVEHHLAISGLCAEIGESERAVRAVEAAVRIAPDDERCRQAQKVIRQLENS